MAEGTTDNRMYYEEQQEREEKKKDAGAELGGKYEGEEGAQDRENKRHQKGFS